MSESYPLPSYAANIWAVGDKIAIGLPGFHGARPHTVLIPPTTNGMLMLWHILRARARDEELARPATIGRASAPVQYNVDEMLRAMGESAPKVAQLPPGGARKEAPATLTLEDLDL